MPLIVLEGIDGCGKSTQIERIGARFTERGIRHRRMREPGGTVLGEQIRALLLDNATEACPTAELFGYLTARAQLCHAVIKPALNRREFVLLDRFWYSTMAYQAYGLGLDVHLVRAAIDLALDGLHADLAMWLRIMPEHAMQRRAAARGEDRIEARGLAYQQRVHDGYATMAAAGDLHIIDAERDPDTIFAELWSAIEPLLHQPN